MEGVGEVVRGASGCEGGFGASLVGGSSLFSSTFGLGDPAGCSVRGISVTGFVSSFTATGSTGTGGSGGNIDAKRSGRVETGSPGVTAEDSTSGSLSVDGDRRSK